MAATKYAVSEKTRTLILEKALELFRSRGFDSTTMRDIAHSAKVATGAAYYYFPSKEAIVAAYYDQVQQRHEASVRESLDCAEDLRDRLGLVIHSKLDILKEDRKFLGALFRFSGEPNHPLSVFGKATQSQREHTIAIFREVLGVVEVSDELRKVLPWALWMMHLGIILFFIHDDSPEQKRTRALVDGVLDLFVQLVKLAALPFVQQFLQPFQAKLAQILHQETEAAESSDGKAF
jgi:AcrR family transcriptional regulator